MKPLVVLGLTLFLLVPVCAAQDSLNHLDAALKPYTDQQLIECLKEETKNCPITEEQRGQVWIAGELGRRNHPDLLIAAYSHADKIQRLYLAEALWQIDNPKVATFMRSIAFNHLPPGQDTEEVFFPLDYLAQRCDQRALARLNRRVNFDKSFPMGCIYFAPTVAAFGRCNYRAAAPNLALALHAACLNITGAAEEGLQKFFPGACLHEKSIDDEARSYKRLLRDHPYPTD